MKNDFYEYLDYYVPNPRCELDYKRDYELLLATVLSAQCTDKRVNMVTKTLFQYYDLEKLANASNKEIETIIKPCGSYSKKAEYIIKIARNLIENYDGKVPNNRNYLETLPGVGRKTCNVVLKNLFNEPCIAVDTHVLRVSKRLGLAQEGNTPLDVEKRLMKIIPKKKWNKVGEQLLLFGRYKCKAIKPECSSCLFKSDCKYYKERGRLINE